MKYLFSLALLLAGIFVHGTISLPAACAEWRPILIVADKDYPPLNFLENGRPTGVCIDIIQVLSQVAGRDMPVQLEAWDKAQELVQRGGADVLGPLAVTDARRASYDFTDTVLSIEYSLFVKSDETEISSLKDLKGKAVGVTEGGFPHQALRGEPGINLVIVASYQNGLQQLRKGRIQAFAGDKWVALYYLQQDDIKDLKVLDKPFAVKEAAFAVRKGNLPLRDELNSALAELKRRGAIKEILRKWSGKQMVIVTREKMRLTVTIAVCLMATILLILLCFWISTLKRQIAERKRAEELLSTSEERYRTLVENAPDAIIVYDVDLAQIVDANSAAVQLFGYDREELVGSAPQRFFTDEQPDGLPITESMTYNQTRALAGEEVAVERSIHTLTGAIRICEVRLVKLQAQEARLLRASFIDVTGRKLAEENQIRSEEKLRGIFENAPVGIYQSSIVGGIISVNPSMARMFGYDTPEEMIFTTSGISVRHYVHPEQRQSLMREALSSAGFAQSEVEFRRRDGSHFVATIQMRVARGEAGAVNYLEGFVEDITSRKQALSELRKLSQAVEQSPVSIVISDTSGVIEFVNPKFTQLTGYGLKEALGQNPRILKSGEIPLEVYRDLWSTISAGRVWEGEFHNKKKSGEFFWEHATISAIRDSAGTITNYLAIKEDITEQKNMKEQLFQAQKMEAIGQLAGGVAHDFNNILTVIVGYAGLLSFSPLLDPSLVEKVDQILASADKAAQLTRGLLAFSRKQVMDPKPADLNSIVRQVETFLVRIIGEDVPLKLVLNAPELIAKVDSGQIEQVLVNLATNARDAMPKGGLLVIETGMQVDPPADHAATLRKPGSYAVISVSDTGCGMDEATRSRIFEPFFTTKEVGKGTGLGMAIVHGVVNQHNGFINVYSEPGHGTTFKIYLPLMPQSTAGKLAGNEPGPSVADPVRGGSETILVAEDDAAVGALVHKVLTGYGYRVILADDGEKAVALFREHRKAVSMVVMDMIMPKKSGCEAAEEIESIKQGVRILFTSGYTKDFILSRGELEEGTELILKPVQPLELLRKVREMLDRSPAASDHNAPARHPYGT